MAILEPGDASGQTQRWRDSIELAMVLRAHPATVPRAIELLEQVASEAWGTASGTEAARLLASLEPPAAPSPPPDAAGVAFRKKWLTIQSLGDPRLPDLLKHLDEPPGLPADGRAAVVRDLRRWLLAEADAADAAQDLAALAAVRPQHEAATVLAERIVTMPRLAAELRPALERLWEAGSGVSLRTLAGDIARACAEWAIDRAWHLLHQVDNHPPDSLTAEIRRLQLSIDEADHLRSQVEAIFATLPRSAPKRWAEARAAVEWAATVRAFFADERVPRGRREDLRAAADHLLAGVRELAARQAAEARELTDLRRFWRHFRNLAEGRDWARLEVGTGWFAAALDQQEKALDERLRAATGPEELAEQARSLAVDLAELPPAVVTRLAVWTERLQAVAAGWKQMLQGEYFSLPDHKPESLPAVLSAALPRYRALLARLRKASEQLDRPGTDRARERSRAKATKTAAAVLLDIPEHAEALRLAQRAAIRKRGAELDRALAGWDVEGFLESCRRHAPGAIASAVRTAEEPYLALAATPQPLQELAKLAGLPALQGTSGLAAWWQAWRGALAALPDPRPAALSRVVAAEEERRHAEWLQALDQVLANAAAPQPGGAALEPLREALASLREAPPGQDFEAYAEQLRRRECSGRVAQLLAAGDLDQAAILLAELAGQPEHRLLQARLLIEQARGAGAAALAPILQRHWGDVLAAYGDDQAYGMLDDCLVEAWRRDATTTLGELAEVARRVTRTPEASPAVRTRALGWLRWLQVEAALAETTGAAGLQQLLAFAATETVDRDERLRSQIARWERRGDTVALTWAFRAFPTLFPGTDPAAQLRRQSEDAAQAAAAALTRESDAGAEPVTALAARLAPIERAWRNLDDFLDLVPHRVDRPQPPETFTRVRQRLAQLIDARARLAQLESADLRGDDMRALWSATRLSLVELRDLPAAAALLDRIDRLRPLTLLKFDQGRLRTAAERCGSDDPHELEQAGLFAQAGERVHTIMKAFETARMAGQPMCDVLSREYWSELAKAAGDLLPPPAAADLTALARRFDALEAEEEELRQALATLRAREPILTAAASFDPESPANRSYLALYPARRPGARRLYAIFDRFAHIAPQPAILRQGAGLLPTWIQEYLEKGAP